MMIEDAVTSAPPPSPPPLALLKAAADPTRLRLLRLLGRAELNVGELVEATGLGQSRVSRHLASLRASGILDERHEGPRAYLRLTETPPPGSEGLLTALREIVEAPGFGHAADLDGLAHVLAARSRERSARFDRLAGDWDGLRRELLGPALGPGELAGLLLPPGGRWVDIGAGTGLLLPWLAALAGPTGEVRAVEAAPRMAEAARARVASLGLDNVRVLPGDMDALPLPDGWADGVVFSLSLGHAEAPAQALAEARRVTRPGGTVAVADVEAHGHRDLVEALGPGFGGFQPAALARMLREAGLRDLRRIPATTPNAPPLPRDADEIPRLHPLRLVARRPEEARPEP